MKSSKIVKIILIIMISFSIVLVASNVFAETDLTDTLMGNDDGNVSLLTGNNNVVNGENNNITLTTNNVSNYNNTTNTLPKTGVGDSIPGVIFVLVLGISAVYAYKKMQDYKNI